MSDSFRITVKENDQSAVVLPNTGATGATVIKASRGPSKPVYIGKGQKSRILDIFGKPSSTYPGVWEAIEYNNKYPLWLAAPTTGGRYGGVLVKTSGTVALTGNGVESVSAIDFTAFPVIETVGTGDGSTTNFTKTVTDYTDYVNQSIDVYTAGESITVTASDAEPEVLTSASLSAGSFTRASGALDITFDTAPAVGEKIEVYYEVDISADTYFALFSRDPEADYMSTMITYDTTTELFSVHLYKKSGTTYSEITGSPFTVSPVEGTLDGFGKNVYAIDLFKDSDYVVPAINADLALSTFYDDSAKTDFAGGSRGTQSATELQLSWDYFQQKNTYPIDIFFDTTADSSVPDLFNTLRTSYQKYSAYILPLPNSSASTAKSTKSGYSISNRGLYFYWNWFRVKDNYNNSSFWTNLIGRVAGKHGDMHTVYNGLAPAWVDESGYGGQLGGGILEAAYDPDEATLKDLNDNQINPIIFHPQYGVMITSDRTSLTSLSDYSFIPHSRLADWIIKNILEQVLPYQLVKLNDNAHRTRVKTKADTLIGPLVAPPYNLLRDFATKCDEENNDDTVLNLRQFILSVAVKFTPFSEYCILLFTNTDQGTDVTEAV